MGSRVALMKRGRLAGGGRGTLCDRALERPRASASGRRSGAWGPSPHAALALRHLQEGLVALGVAQRAGVFAAALRGALGGAPRFGELGLEQRAVDLLGGDRL